MHNPLNFSIRPIISKYRSTPIYPWNSRNCLERSTHKKKPGNGYLHYQAKQLTNLKTILISSVVTSRSRRSRTHASSATRRGFGNGPRARTSTYRGLGPWRWTWWRPWGCRPLTAFRSTFIHRLPVSSTSGYRGTSRGFGHLSFGHRSPLIISTGNGSALFYRPIISRTSGYLSLHDRPSLTISITISIRSSNGSRTLYFGSSVRARSGIAGHWPLGS